MQMYILAKVFNNSMKSSQLSDEVAAPLPSDTPHPLTRFTRSTDNAQLSSVTASRLSLYSFDT